MSTGSGVAAVVLKHLEKLLHCDWPELDDGSPAHAPIGTYSANGFGLHDVHGNVFEWCSDWFSEDFYKATSEDDPEGPADGVRRVLRGGSWRELHGSARTASRSVARPDERGFNGGLRLAASVLSVSG